jgi:sugar phosphate isomerase/epimerase
MKRTLVALAAIFSLYACKTPQNTTETRQPVVASIDLINVKDDKVKVEVDPDRFTRDTTRFFIPRTVPGTYSIDNYGKFIEEFKALDYDGNELSFEKTDDNTWLLSLIHI